MSETQTKVVIYTSAYDTGGQGYRIKRAFDRHQPKFSVRSIHTLENAFAYPHDMRYKPEPAYELFAEADILHMRNGIEGLSRLRARATKPQSLIVHHHGTRFREGHATIAPELRGMGALQVASTLDLTLLEPDVSWLPSPFDLGELAMLRAGFEAQKMLASEEKRPIRIAHAPTNRQVKSTEVIMAAVMALHVDGVKVEFDLIERQPNYETLRRKAKADIVIDQLELGYGNNAIEAWGMGLPVVGGVKDPEVRAHMTAQFGTLPFFEADEVDLVDRLRVLVLDADLRAHWGQVGKKHAETYHDEKAVARLLASYYRSAMASEVATNA